MRIHAGLLTLSCGEACLNACPLRYGSSPEPEKVFKGVLPAPGASQILSYGGVLTERYLHRVVGGDIVGKAIANRFSIDFGAEGAE